MTTTATLAGLLEQATGTGGLAIAGLERPLPWEVWTSNSFRRVKTARGVDVLSGYQCKDGCVDLSMPEDRLVALVAAVNALPELLARIAALEEALEGVLPYTEAERLAELARARVDRTARMPIRQAIKKARAALTLKENDCAS